MRAPKRSTPPLAAAALMAAGMVAAPAPARAEGAVNNCIRLVGYGEPKPDEASARNYDLGFRRLALPENAAKARLTLEIGSVDEETLKRPVIIRNEDNGTTARFTAKLETRHIFLLSSENDRQRGEYRFTIALGYREAERTTTLLTGLYRAGAPTPVKIELASYPLIDSEIPPEGFECLSRGMVR